MTFSDLWRIFRQKPKLSIEKPIKIGKSDDEKALELEERRNEIELNRLKINEAKRVRFRKELDDLHADIIEDSKDDLEDEEVEEDVPFWLAPFMPLITQKLQEVGKNEGSHESPQAQHDYIQPQVFQQPVISDDELRDFLNKIPKNQVRMAKIMPKPVLYKMINQKMPISQQDFERGYQILVSEY